MFSSPTVSYWNCLWKYLILRPLISLHTCLILSLYGNVECFWHLLRLSNQEFAIFWPFWFHSFLHFLHVIMTGLLPNIVFVHRKAASFLENQMSCSPGCRRGRVHLDWKIWFRENKTRPGIFFKQHNNSTYSLPETCEFQPQLNGIFVTTHCSSAAIEEVAARWWHSKGHPCFRKWFPRVGL